MQFRPIMMMNGRAEHLARQIMVRLDHDLASLWRMILSESRLSYFWILLIAADRAEGTRRDLFLFVTHRMDGSRRPGIPHVAIGKQSLRAAKVAVQELGRE
jgi:hypothetical protein